MIIFNGIVM